VKSREGALREAASLATPALPTFIHRTEVPEKGTWWRVYAGPYGIREEADRASRALHAQGREYAQVYRVPRAEVETGTGRGDR
jgi:hypothetical protein